MRTTETTSLFTCPDHFKAGPFHACNLKGKATLRQSAGPGPPGWPRKRAHLTVGGQAGVTERRPQEPHEQVLHLARTVALTQEALLEDPQAGHISGRVKA